MWQNGLFDNQCFNFSRTSKFSIKKTHLRLMRQNQNLVRFVSHKLIPNDFRTRMYLELNKYENTTVKKALKIK